MQNFAKDTGDFATLSKVDMDVIALGVAMSRRKNEHHMVKTEPQPLKEFRPAHFDNDYKRKFDESRTSDDSSDAESSDEGSSKKKAAVDSDDDWNNVADDRQTRRTKKRTDEKTANWNKKNAKKAAKREHRMIEMDVPVQESTADEESDPDAIDDEEEGGEWVTQENLHKHLINGLVIPIAASTDADGNPIEQE